MSIGFVGDLWDDITGKSAAEQSASASRAAGEQAATGQLESARIAADAMKYGANMSAAEQKAALDYLKEREALPRQFSEAGLKGLAGIYGLPGGTGSQQELIDRATQSPLYKSILGGKEAGEEAILRNAAATGGLRSGDVQSNLYDYNTQLQNQALLQSYNEQLSGLTGLAGLPSNANQIASAQAGIGQTLGQGYASAGQAMAQGQLGASQALSQSSLAAGQAMAAGKQQGIGNLMGLGSMGLAMFSDRRLKKNIRKVTEINGHNWYIWDWNIVANKMGLDGQSEGVLADEIAKTDPDCIGFKDGFMVVDYAKLGIFKGVAHA